ncbi:MAG: FGGY-family carbohydrate kinase [Fimbriimonadaceae bacterium]
MPEIEAVAVDLGASSARIATGRLEGGRIRFEIVEQVTHEPIHWCGQLTWDMDALMRVARKALRLAQENEATLAIDSWGVDVGFLSMGEKLIPSPVCYRDLSHERVFQSLKESRDRIYGLTGIQHQPFNTLYQLVARAQDSADLRNATWLMMPDLISCLLGAPPNIEQTNASTTQLCGLDGNWCEEIFDLIGWPMPEFRISNPGRVLTEFEGARIVSCASHDTASAVFGMGTLTDDVAFMSVGTWSLIGCLLDEPNLADPGFTNERAIDGRVRYLANVPGFYVVNRVHEELGIKVPVPEWLAMARPDPDQTYPNLMDPKFFNPVSMCEALGETHDLPTTIIGALSQTSASQLKRLERNTGRTFSKIRAAGGGSESEVFCQSLANATGIPVESGPKEATVLGNLACQFWAEGKLESFQLAREAIDRSFDIGCFCP